MEVGEALMMILFLITIIGFIISIIYSKHLHIDFSSFFKKGFKKLDSLFGIYCYTGKQGTGKTYSAVKFTEESRKKFNYKVLTNVKSLSDRNDGITLDEYIKNKKKYKNVSYIYEKDIFKIIEFCTKFKENDENVMIFFDEIFTALEKMGSLSKEVLSFLSQLRKRRIIFITTAQEWSEIHITFRRYIRFQVSCRMLSVPFLKTAFVSNQVNDGDLIHWDNDCQDFIAPTIQTNFSKGLKSVIDLYDAFETIDMTRSMNVSRR